MGGWAIAVHGGAGIDPNLPHHRQTEAKLFLHHCLRLGAAALSSSAAAIDVVELVVRELESDPLFNSGRGSALTEKSSVEMEASIMDGTNRSSGAVSGVSTVKNPISLARLVMDKSPHSYLAFSGAEEFARAQGVETMDPEYFITEESLGTLKLAKEAKCIIFDYRIPQICGPEACAAFSPEKMMNGIPIEIYSPETVGCVAVDGEGRCAAATSTGGLVNKTSGRIGDSALIGCGTYACSECAVSCTGEGEAIIRATLGREVAALMEYGGMKLQEAVDYAVGKRLEKGKAGLIAVSRNGEVVCGFNTVGMFRGLATQDGLMQVDLW